MKIDFPYSKELLVLNDIFNKNNSDNLRIVGGAIRNFLLGKEIIDFDLSCKFNPNEVIEILKKNNIKQVPTGVDFGTVTAIINGKSFEITSTREDIATDGRHAVVKYTDSFEIDAGRRDFTFNALYLDFNGNVFDYFDGLSDLQKGIVRFIGNSEKRIKEDYLRILRFFRFYCYYGSILDNEGLKSCIKYKDNLIGLSGERIKNEMKKILISNYPVKTLKIMEQYGILQIIFDINKFNFDYLEILFSIKKYINFSFGLELALSLLIRNIDELNILKNKWKLSNKEYLNTLNLLENIRDNLYDIEDLKRILFLNNNDKNFTINLFIFNSVLNYNKISGNLPEYINKNIEYINKFEFIKFPIDGNNLLNLGLKENKKFKDILNYGKDIFIKSNFSLSKDKLLDKIKQKFMAGKE